MTKRITAIILLPLIFCLALDAEEVVGKITHIRGLVDITRNGDYLNPGDLEIGLGIENFDILTTEENGEIFIELTKGDTPGAEIRVQPGTIFSIDLEKIGSANKTSISLMTGSISLKVQKLAGNMALDVNTEAASMGVRGTNFSVQCSPGGGILVACDEGKVECASASGKKVFATPGTIVEQTPEEEFRSIPVALSSFEKFKDNWMAEQIDAFKANPLKAVRQYAARYKKHYAAFNKAYNNLMKNKEIILRWIKEDRDGKISGKMQAMKDKKALLKDLLTIRRSLFFFEKTYYRLTELEKYYKQGIGRGVIEPGLTTDKFFKNFRENSKDLKAKMNNVKYIIKLFAKRNNGSFTLDSFDDDETDDDFFEKDDF